MTRWWDEILTMSPINYSYWWSQSTVLLISNLSPNKCSTLKPPTSSDILSPLYSVIQCTLKIWMIYLAISLRIQLITLFYHTFPDVCMDMPKENIPSVYPRSKFHSMSLASVYFVHHFHSHLWPLTVCRILLLIGYNEQMSIWNKVIGYAKRYTCYEG